MSKEQIVEWAKKAAKGIVLDQAELAFNKLAQEQDTKREIKYKNLEEGYQNVALKAYLEDQKVDQRLKKAMLIPRTGEITPKIEFMFNPKEFNLMHKIQLENMSGSRTVRGLPKVNYGFVEPRTINLQGLIFDTYEQGRNVLADLKPLLDAFDFTNFYDPFKKQGEYQERINKVNAGNTLIKSLGKEIGVDAIGVNEYGTENLAQQSIELRRPPVYYFIWGDKNYMCCMIESLNCKLMMFLPNGTPVRASIDISLKEVDLGVANRGFSKRQKFISSSGG